MRFYAPARGGGVFGTREPSLAAAASRGAAPRLRGGVTANATAAATAAPLSWPRRRRRGVATTSSQAVDATRLLVPARGTDDRSPRYSCAECAPALFVFAATGGALMTAFSTTIGSFVNAAALRIVSELAKPVERSASVPKRPLLFMLASVLQAASKNPQRHDLSERDARAPTAPSGPRHTTPERRGSAQRQSVQIEQPPIDRPGSPRGGKSWASGHGSPPCSR